MTKTILYSLASTFYRSWLIVHILGQHYKKHCCHKYCLLTSHHLASILSARYNHIKAKVFSLRNNLEPFLSSNVIHKDFYLRRQGTINLVKQITTIRKYNFSQTAPNFGCDSGNFHVWDLWVLDLVGGSKHQIHIEASGLCLKMWISTEIIPWTKFLIVKQFSNGQKSLRTTISLSHRLGLNWTLKTSL